MPNPARFTDLQTLKILWEVESGESIRGLAREYDADRRTVYRALERAREIIELDPGIRSLFLGFAQGAAPDSEESDVPIVKIDTEALCFGDIPQRYEYDPDEYPLKEAAEWKSDIEHAIDVCISCPIMIQCGASATLEERTWTVRGGLEPLAYIDQQVSQAA